MNLVPKSTFTDIFFFASFSGNILFYLIKKVRRKKTRIEMKWKFQMTTVNILHMIIIETRTDLTIQFCSMSIWFLFSIALQFTAFALYGRPNIGATTTTVKINVLVYDSHQFIDACADLLLSFYFYFHFLFYFVVNSIYR